MRDSFEAHSKNRFGQPLERSRMSTTTNPRSVFLFRPTLSEGGADRVTITLLRHLNRQWFRPTLVLVKRDGTLIDDIPDDVRVIDLGVSRLRFSWLELATVLRREKPDILLSTSSGGNIIASLAHAAASDPKPRLILSERSTFSAVRRERRPTWLPVATITRQLYKRAHRIIAVSEGVAMDLREALRLPADLVTAIYNPLVDEELHRQADEPVDHPWFAESTPILLAVGRLVVQKDYPSLLHAFRQLRSTRPVRLIILGEGAMRKDLEALASGLEIRSDVDFLGFVKNPFPFMKRCTVYVLCSRIEGLPGALIQAMACGAPVVSTDCPHGPAEIIDQGTSGFLVPVGDPSRLAAAVSRVLDDPGLRGRFSETGRIVAGRFQVSSMMRLYEEALLGSLLTESQEQR